MSYSPYSGATFLIPSGPKVGQMHLFAVVTERCRDGAHLLLSMASIVQGRHHDPACLVNVGDHNFIQHPSYVSYAQPQQRPATLISNYVEKGVYVPRDDLAPALLERILMGLVASNFSRPWAVKYCRANLPLSAGAQCRQAFGVQ